MSDQPSISHITIPEVTLRVLDGPVSLAHARANLDEHGHFNGIVDMDVRDVVGHGISYDAFLDSLAAALIEGIEPYNLSFEVLAIDAQHETAYVRVSTDVFSYLDALGIDGDPSEGEPCPKHRALGVNPGCGDCDHPDADEPRDDGSED